jgi:hypothetical protein
MRPVIIPGPQGPHIADEQIFIKWSKFMKYVLKDQNMEEKYKLLTNYWLSKNIHIKCYPLSNKRCPDCIYLGYSKKIIHMYQKATQRHKRLIRRNFHKACNII